MARRPARPRLVLIRLARSRIEVLTMPENSSRTFLTVAEAAEILRVDDVTIYRAIRDDAFPAVKIRGRYIIPAQAVDALAREATDAHRCIDVADYVLRPRREVTP